MADRGRRVKFNNLLFVSGQAGTGDGGKIVAGGFRAQGEQAFANFRRALEAGGSGLEDVIKVTNFVTDMGHFKDIVELRCQFFAAPYPADTIAEIKALYGPAAMIEIEAIAAVRPNTAPIWVPAMPLPIELICPHPTRCQWPLLPFYSGICRH